MTPLFLAWWTKVAEVSRLGGAKDLSSLGRCGGTLGQDLFFRTPWLNPNAIVRKQHPNVGLVFWGPHGSPGM